MQSKLKRIKSVLVYADEQQREISDEYSQYMDGDLPAKIQIKIKNYFENLRSILDYIAHDICENILDLDDRHKCYFPIWCETENKFTSFCHKNFPNLENIDPKIYSELKRIQPFRTDDFYLLKLLTNYVNKNKHCDLSSQELKIEKTNISKFKVIKFEDAGKISQSKDNCYGYLVADETGNDPFLGSEYILGNIGNIIEINPDKFTYQSYSFLDSDDDVIATLMNLQSSVSNIVEFFIEPLYQKQFNNQA
jgi:hypothetical protein